MLKKQNYMCINKVSTRGKDYMDCIRATYYKSGYGRNFIENIVNGRGYTGVIEIYEEIKKD